MNNTKNAYKKGDYMTFYEVRLPYQKEKRFDSFDKAVNNALNCSKEDVKVFKCKYIKGKIKREEIEIKIQEIVKKCYQVVDLHNSDSFDTLIEAKDYQRYFARFGTVYEVEIVKIQGYKKDYFIVKNC